MSCWCTSTPNPCLESKTLSARMVDTMAGRDAPGQPDATKAEVSSLFEPVDISWKDTELLAIGSQDDTQFTAFNKQPFKPFKFWKEPV